MIIRTNGSKWGIKNSGENFTPEIHSLINNAKNFIVVCGYNFSPLSHSTSIIPLLIAKRNEGINILFIAPPNMFSFGRVNHTTNIQHLVNNNVAVVLNSSNHSKWILSDYGYYYGSLNFTHSSMVSKVEVVSFCDTLLRSRTPKWMLDTRNELLSFAINETRETKNIISTLHLEMVNIDNLRILRLALCRILKFNPSIEKIKITLLNYEEIRLLLSQTIDQSFLFCSEKSLNELWTKISRIILYLDGLAVVGNSIFLNEQVENTKQLNLELAKYNRIHNIFQKEVIRAIEFIEEGGLKEIKKNKLPNLIEEALKALSIFNNKL